MALAGQADRPEGAKEAWRLLLPAPSGRERGERAGERCRSRGILFELKESPLTIPKKNSGGVSIPPPDPSYDQRKGFGPSFGNHPGGWTGERGLRGTVGRGTGVRSGVLAAIQGVLPCGRRGWGRPGSSGADIGWLGTCGGRGGGTPGRRALRVVEESLINHPGTGSRRRSRLAARRMVGATGRRRQ